MATTSLQPLTSPQKIGEPEEREFYNRYPWALNIYNETGVLRDALRREILALGSTPPDWRRTEILMNVYLLGCAISDSVADWLQGNGYDFGKAEARVPLLRPAAKAVRALLHAGARFQREKNRIRTWRERWEFALGEYLVAMQRSLGQQGGDPAGQALRLSELLNEPVPVTLQQQRCRIPAAFRSQDLTYWDVANLAEKLARALPDRSEPVLIVGCRTAGSYFAPVVRASLRLAGFEKVNAITVRPKRGLSSDESAAFARIRQTRGRVVLVDEPINSGATMRKVLGLLRGFQIPSDRVHMLVPVHPSRREWRDGNEGFSFSKIKVLTLDPEEWFKARNAVTDRAQQLFSTYFNAAGAVVDGVEPDDALEAWLAEQSDQKFHSRMKHAYRVRLRRPSGAVETKRVLAKSVGFGWFSYAAYLAADRMSGFVPPLIGMRDGMLYTEWVEDGAHQSTAAASLNFPDVAAQYIAARVRCLRFERDPVPAMAKAGQHKGFEELSGLLSKAYGWKGIGFLARPRILDELLRNAFPVPTLIDGKMRPAEWVTCGERVIKTDFEHHGQGKTELNVSDPAYDLADTILHGSLDREEERKLLTRYRELSGDAGIEQRLLLYKLLAGSWAMARAFDNLRDERLQHLHAEANRTYIRAFDFLTEHVTRRCGETLEAPCDPAWGTNWAVLDIDGVIDKQIFGFPSNTAAGCGALGRLRNHGFALALNTARSLAQVKLYAEAYGCAGAVAEYGSVAWDRVTGQERVLVTSESLAQMDTLKSALRTLPGVYLNENYRYSIRAFVYERGVTVPIQSSIIRNLLAALRTDRLRLHQTYTDSTIIAAEVDKGSGLRELVKLSGARDVRITAIGDSEPDLPMFTVADAAWAPGHISCRQTAQLLGCRVASSGYQAGLAEIANRMVHPDGKTCGRCAEADRRSATANDLFTNLLRIADRSTRWRLRDALFSRHAVRAFQV